MAIRFNSADRARRPAAPAFVVGDYVVRRKIGVVPKFIGVVEARFQNAVGAYYYHVSRADGSVWHADARDLSARVVSESAA